jgi:hypothetical protein
MIAKCIKADPLGSLKVGQVYELEDKGHNYSVKDVEGKVYFGISKENFEEHFEVFRDKSVMKALVLFGLMQDYISTKDFNMLEIIRAAEMLIADCVAQSGIGEEAKNKFFYVMGKEIPNLVRELEQLHKDPS